MDSNSLSYDYFDVLHDNLVMDILSMVASSASSPSDFFNIILVCKRFKRLALHRLVLANAGSKVFSLKARNWSENTHEFFNFCVRAGNIHACYTLGMIRFYCLQHRLNGVQLLSKAKGSFHASATYSLAVMLFNGSGGSDESKYPEDGAVLCTRASYLGHMHATYDLAHCYANGLGVGKDVAEAKRLRRRASSLKKSPMQRCQVDVHRFMREWYESGRGVLAEGLWICSYNKCGRVETRVREFLVCKHCRTMRYCSHACRELHHSRHRKFCLTLDFENLSYHPSQ